MKVYYNIDTLPEFDISGELGNEELENFIASKINLFKDLAETNIALKWKYRIMWELRKLESDINYENGVIVFKSKEWLVRGFSEELNEEIVSILQSIDENSF